MPRKLNTAPADDWPTIDETDWPEIDMQTKRRKTGGALSPEKMTLPERRLECYRRRLEGATFEEIAEVMNINTSTAWRNCQAMADEVRTRAMDTAEALLWLEVARLDSIMAKNWKGAMLGLVGPTSHVFKCIELRSRLLGLFAATKIESKTEVKPPDGHYAVDALGLSVETRMALLEGMERVKAKSVTLAGMKPIK